MHQSFSHGFSFDQFAELYASYITLFFASLSLSLSLSLSVCVCVCVYQSPDVTLLTSADITTAFSGEKIALLL